MTSIARDENHIPVLAGLLDSNGTTITQVKVDPSLHALQIHDGDTGTDHGPVDASRDENFKTVGMGVSSLDGVTPVAIYVNSSGELLIDSI